MMVAFLSEGSLKPRLKSPRTSSCEEVLRLLDSKLWRSSSKVPKGPGGL